MKSRKNKNTKQKKNEIRAMLRRKDKTAHLSDDAVTGAACEYTDEQYERNRIDCHVEESWGYNG